MKKAIIALDGGGSNLRIIIVDKDTEEQLYFSEIDTGTNLSTVPDKAEALANIQKLITDGYNSDKMQDYVVAGIGLSSAGTEIEENKKALEVTLEKTVDELKKTSVKMQNYPPKLFVTNDIDILLHSSDIALVAGTGTVGAYKYYDIKPWDNTDEIPEPIIQKVDGAGQFVGDIGSGYWIATRALIIVAMIEDRGAYINSKGEVVKTNGSLLRELILDKLCEVGVISPELTERAKETSLKDAGAPDFISLVYAATEENGKPYGRAKVGKMFAKLVDEAAWQGDEVANDILEGAANEIFTNIEAGFNKGHFTHEYGKEYNLLLSGSVMVHSELTRAFLVDKLRQNYPNININVNKEKPVISTVKYVKNELDRAKEREEEVR